jgi:flavin reductase (DIM6/NTAB) family NADH-FMN oxidoreductase RutF
MATDTVIDPVLMRSAMGQFATGVTVITTMTPSGAPAGCTVSAFCSVSLDPPLVLVCVGKGRLTHDALAHGPGYAVNILRADQTGLAKSFARQGDDRFAGVQYTAGRHGIPLLDGAIAQVECDLHAVLDGGDHAIVLGLVRDLNVTEGEPLLYSQGAFLDLPRKNWDQAQNGADHEWLLSAPW